MNKLLVIIFLSLLVLFTQTSCLKNRNDIRIRNNFGMALKVKVGPTDYGTVNSVSTTEYKMVPDGTNEITGDISGSITLQKRSKAKYTININTAGVITLVEDSK